jgi:spermidine/putrescine transport system substrate-binding protein
MSDNSVPTLRALVPTATANAFGRRSFLGALGATAALPLLAACGTSSDSTKSAGGGGRLEKELSVYLYGAEYDDPKTFTNFTAARGPVISLDSFSSSQELIAKLAAANGTSGYDLVQPGGVYIPQMISNKLLMPLDHAALPNLSNVDSNYLGQEWDPKNEYSVCKSWGTTGYLYDTTKITRPMTTWNDFLDAAQNEAAGSTTVLDVPENLVGIYFWANGIDWTTTNKSDLDAARSFLTSKLAPNLKAFDSYPGTSGAMSARSHTLMQAWNGDARQGLLADKNPGQYKWVLPGPVTEIWMDNWCIAAGAPHYNAANAFINYVLDPKNSLREIQFTGLNTGVKKAQALAVAEKTKRLDMIFFTPEQVATMQPGEINDATQAMVDIMGSVKAAAAAA